MVRILLIIAGWYAVFCVGAYVFQRALQYFPDTTPPGRPADSGVPEMQAVTMTTSDGLELLAWFAPPEKEGGRIIVMFHGNAGNIAMRAQKARYFISRGYGVMLPEYRGYGGNAGSPSEEGFYRDARAALAWLRKEGYSAAQFVLYGESIGSGVAVQMALETQPKALVIEAGFSSALDVAKLHYFWLPVSLLIKDRFDSAAKIGEVRSALLSLHGDADAVIPRRLGRQLYEAARGPKEFAVVPEGGHNDLYNFGAGKIIEDWLERQE